MRRILLILAWLLVPGSPVSAQIVTDPAPVAQLGNWDSRAVTAPAGAPTTLVPFTVDPSLTGQDVLDVAASDPAAVITLRLPDGTEIGAANAAARGFSYSVLAAGSFANSMLPSSFQTPGTHTLIVFPGGSPAGTYQVRINNAAAATETLVIASYFSSSAVRAALLTDAPLYRSGEEVLLSALLFDGTSPILPAGTTITARIGNDADPLAVPGQVTLLDSGVFDADPADGIYTGTYVPPAPGRYTAAIRATGVSLAGVPFSRTASTSFRVLAPTAAFAAFRDAGADDNGDTRLDRIVVTADVTVTVPGRYRFGVSLLASNGQVTTANAAADLSSGNQSIDVSFRAEDVFALGVDGPFELVNATLLHEDDPEAPVVDRREHAGMTAPYLRSDLSRDPLLLTGAFTVTPIDTNGNGKFDVLRFDVGVDLLVPGFYNWTGRLVAPNGTELDFAAGSAVLAAGTSVIGFSFDGATIAASCLAGPYALRSVLLFGAGGSLTAAEAGVTEAFSPSQFEGASACNAAPVANAGGDRTVPAGATVILDGSASSDPDGDSLTFSWTGPFGTLTGPIVSVVLPLGVHTITLTVDDGRGGVASDDVIVTVVNSAPIAHDDAARTLEATPVTIAVLANDTDSDGGVLSVIETGTPAHGTAVAGAGGVIVYTPAGRYFGPDAFTYTVSDGQGGTAQANVTIAISRLGRFVALAAEELELGERAKVVTGDVGANSSGRGRSWRDDDGPRHHGRYTVEVTLGEDATMLQPGSRVVGDTVSLGPDSSVFNLFYNELINRHARVRGEVVHPVTLPFVPLPSALPVASGGRDVTVGRNARVTLGPGVHGRIRVRSRGTLVLSGGLYQLRSVDVESDATILVSGPSDVRVRGELGTGDGARLIVSPGLRASDVKIFVAGDDGSCGHDGRRRDHDHNDREDDDEDATAVHLGRQNVIQANIHAPEGTLQVGSRTVMTGAFIAKRVRVGWQVELRLDSAFE